jgi:hypothetical protein
MLSGLYAVCIHAMCLYAERCGALLALGAFLLCPFTLISNTAVF